MKLPFGLTQKPINKKFEHGQIHFSLDDGVMSFIIKHTEKDISYPVLEGVLKTKEQLDYLLNIKSFPIRVNAQMEIVFDYLIWGNTIIKKPFRQSEKHE